MSTWLIRSLTILITAVVFYWVLFEVMPAIPWAYYKG